VLRLRRSNVVFPSLVAAVAITAGVLFAPGPRDAAAQELQTIRMAVGPYFDYTPWAIAQELGLDEEMSLKVELITVAKISLAIREGGP
jgi:ABC-type nitrate/sulfonate/bicarbonate transport system substrate-binding protein